ncbi:MAG TPA: TRAP transporter substrate-binding protein [Bacillota bacterium]|nr:TRAP transporter substrate-binding protein [Bacillota bacterium]HQI16662.1 TRAP transporter substrate-binding protein [Bacillota bacterium]HQJ37453.1 TRAP transporter substrate-binding protein [Bacillota bacterium]HQL37337.1 TRAP transporter substrate-binding protein [Bacillota bacterium]HRU42012.1 TRAP transporter substrate-binding protein [Candidatus Diapherotrites archaeon]
MKKLYRFMLIALSIIMVFSLTACGEKAAPAAEAPAGEAPAASGSAEPTVLKLGMTINEQDSFYVCAQKFAELVKERTNNAYNIELFPNSALGDERTMLESMQMGTLDAGIITSGPFVNFVPEFGVLDLPFLFPNNEAAYKVLDGEVGKEILAKLEAKDLKGLAYAERGFRNLTNSVRPVKSAADVKGLKIRVMENEVYIASFNALGVNTVPMAWTEALTALQQGTIQGQENPVNVIHAYKMWDSQKYVTMTRHAYAAAVITFSLETFNKLPADIQKIFIDAAQEAAEYERAWVAENEASQIETLKANGMEVIEDPDLESFKAAVQPVYDKYSQYSDYLKRINEAIK